MRGRASLARLRWAEPHHPCADWMCKREFLFLSPVYGREVAYVMRAGRRTIDALSPIGSKVSIFPL